MGARLLVAGYFGCGNLGDDSILLGFLKGIEPHDYGVRVLTGSPEALMRHYGLSSVHRLDVRAVKDAIDECDALVFAGGSIFQDVTSVRSVAYYANLVRAAKQKHKKVVMIGQGVGPLNRFLGKRLATGAFRQADAIAVRDQSSAKTLMELGVKVTPRLAADMAFLMPKQPPSEETGSFGVGNMKAIGISVRPFGRDKSRGVIQAFGDLTVALYRANYVPVLMEMDRNEDGAIIDAISKSQGGKVPGIRGLDTPMQVLQRLGRMEAVIAMRLHAGILAAAVGIPPYMVSYDPKVTAFSNLLGYPAPPTMEGLTGDRILSGFQTFIKDRERNASALQAKNEEFAKLARTNIDVLAACLGA